jgi:hypothetical protein
MNRTTVGYIVMTACAIGIIWVILKFGSRLQAPPDWSGTWQVVEPAIPAKTARIDQSGIFLQLKVGDQPARAYRMERQGDTYWLDHGSGPQPIRFHRDSRGTTLVISDSDLKLWRDANAPAAVQRDGTHH